MRAVPRGPSRFAPVAAVCLFLLILPAQASALLITSPSDPVAGDTLSFSGDGTECANGGPTYTFNVYPSGSQTATYTTTGSAYAFTTTLPAGSYTATEARRCPDPNQNPGNYTLNFTVGPGVSGTITVSPDPPVVGRPANLNVAPSGGVPGYTLSWDLNGDGVFGDDITHNPAYTFGTTGPHTVSVKITDSGDPSAGGNGDPSHTTTVTRTLNVVPASSPAPPPPPPTCYKTVTVKLSEFKTPGCFTKVGNQWTTTSGVTLNGLSLPDYGQTFTVTDSTTAEPGGHFSAPNSTMRVGGLKVFSGNIDWTLPDGQAGQDLVIPGRTFTIASGASLLGLHVRGSVALKLGEDLSNRFYADLPLNIELPVSFHAGPDPAFGSVTGGATLRVDDGGVHFNALKLQAKDVWLGKLNVASVCFSYIPASGQTPPSSGPSTVSDDGLDTKPCDTPSFGGAHGPIAAHGGDEQFISCASDPNTNRWDASAEIEVPSGLQLGAFGGMANGQVSRLGASVSGLGRRVPLAYGMYLEKVAFGLCLSPPPFKIRASVGANFLGASNLFNIDGSFTYTDAVGFNPWSLELDGSVTIGEAPNDLPIGSGNFGVNGNGVIDFGLKAGVDVLGGFASLSAHVDGWLDSRNGNFTISGGGRGCLDGQCADAEGELSSVGVAGCVTIGSSIPTYDLIIPLDGSPVHLDTTTYPLSAGFGYDWNASTAQLLGGSCNFSGYEPTYPVTAADLGTAASAGLGVRVAPGTTAVALRIHGTHGPPKVILRGPRGWTITSPAHARGKLSKGHYLLAENKSDGTTDVLLVHPGAGIWRVSRAPGATSSPTKIDRARLEAPPTFGARVLGASGVRTVQVAYAVPVGTSVRLVERAKGVLHTIAAPLRGHRCPASKSGANYHPDGDRDADDVRPGLPVMRPGTDERILCANIRFRPSEGPGGTRYVQAVVTRRGIPLTQRNIASFRLPRLTLPSRVGTLHAERRNGSLVVAFSPSSGASRYSVAAKLSDGRELAFDLGGRCRALRIANVPAGVAAALRIAGVRFDLTIGHTRSLSIRAGAPSAGRTLRVGRVCT